jgi:hypothetical protein
MQWAHGVSIYELDRHRKLIFISQVNNTSGKRSAGAIESGDMPVQLRLKGSQGSGFCEDGRRPASQQNQDRKN